jgi:hypothetical protein
MTSQIVTITKNINKKRKKIYEIPSDISREDFEKIRLESENSKNGTILDNMII